MKFCKSKYKKRNSKIRLWGCKTVEQMLIALTPVVNVTNINNAIILKAMLHVEYVLSFCLRIKENVVSFFEKWVYKCL